MKTPLLVVTCKYQNFPKLFVLTKSKRSSKNLNKALKSYLRNFPKKEDTLAKRKLAVKINTKVQNLLCLPSFYLSIYTSRYYTVTVS